jgi:phosphoserine phosphatase
MCDLNQQLMVDLDHTLIDTDLLFESSKSAFKKNPLLIFIYPFWLMRGKGYLKTRLLKYFKLEPSQLNTHSTVIDYIKSRKKSGDLIILATASHQVYAQQIFDYLAPLFDGVMASDANFNLSSHHKAQKLVERFGYQKFDYIGDHMRDLPVWEASNLAILANVSTRVINQTKHLPTQILSTKAPKTNATL